VFIAVSYTFAEKGASGIAVSPLLTMNRIMFDFWKRWEKLVRRLGGKFMPGVDEQPLLFGCGNAAAQFG